MVGRTPWSARVPLDLLYAKRKNYRSPKRPTGASAADQGVRPTSASAGHLRRLSVAIPACPFSIGCIGSETVADGRYFSPDRRRLASNARRVHTDRLEACNLFVEEPAHDSSESSDRQPARRLSDSRDGARSGSARPSSRRGPRTRRTRRHGRRFSPLDSRFHEMEWCDPRSSGRRPIPFPIPPNVRAPPIATQPLSRTPGECRNGRLADVSTNRRTSRPVCF